MAGNTSHSGEEFAAILDWYRANGVDLAVGEAPVDQFEAHRQARLPNRPKAPPAPPPPAPSAAGPVSPGPGPSAEGDPREATELAQSAETLDQLRDILERFEGSPLKLRATQLVFADGNPEADIMLIGEAPGRDEDLQGKPFVGRSGQLLDRMLGAIGLDRSKVYIANTVPWRPPGNRTPAPAEIAVCLPFLYRQIELVDPSIVVTLGAPATQTLFGEPVSITRIRGQWRELELGGKKRRALPTLHPAFLLRQPAQKQLAWRDMLSLKKALSN